jgi:hypothetical protein
MLVRLLNLAPWLPAVLALLLLAVVTGLKRIIAFIRALPPRTAITILLASCVLLAAFIFWQTWEAFWKPEHADLRTGEAQMLDCPKSDQTCRDFISSVQSGRIVFYWTGDPISAIISAGQFKPGDLTFPPSHIGLVTDDGVIISASQHGVEYHSAIQILQEYHVRPAVAVVPGLTDAQLQTMLRWTRDRLGKMYNVAGLFTGVAGSDSWYCSEFIQDAFKAAGVDFTPAPHELPHISPLDQLNGTINGQPLDLVFVSPPGWAPFDEQANLNTLTGSTVFNVSLALLAAVVITTGGGWIGSRLNALKAKPKRAAPTANVTITEVIEQPTNAPSNQSTNELPGLFLAGGARVLVIGPTRSGKSTILQHMCRRALADPTFSRIVLLDGKGPELITWSKVVPGTLYHGADDIGAWVEPLETVAAELPVRYAALTQAGLRKAEPGSARNLIIIDEVQRATRGEHGKDVTAALMLIAEQSGALGDVLIITTQRAKHRTLDKNISTNASIIIAMKGPDYPGRFDLYTSMDDHKPARRGQADPADDNDIAAWAAEVAAARSGQVVAALMCPDHRDEPGEKP